MRVSVRQRADEDERYAPGSFDGQVGRQVPIKLDGMRSAPGTLVEAAVAEDGREVTLTFEVPEEHWPRQLRRGWAREWSVGFNA